MQGCRVIKTPKQIEAIRLFVKCVYVCLYGGSRSGKTFIVLYAFVVRALKYAGTLHLVVRLRFNHAKKSICYGTMPVLLKAMGIESKVKLNKTDWFYEFPNGSQIWIGGLDQKERTEKILGNEYASIFPNECNQIAYDSHETLTTRLNPPQGVPPLYIMDYNPPGKTHWGYQIFELRKFPDGRPVPDGDYGKLRMNPHDNKENLSDGYIENTLGNLSAAKRKRFLDGEYGDDNGTLWQREWIKYKRLEGDAIRIVVGVDPSGSATGDECGIVVAAKYGSEYYVLDDYSRQGTPSAWAHEVAEAYERWKADAIIGEKNYGGEMVEYTIKTHAPRAKIKAVSATRGKVVRAEPISALYEQGKVWHNQVMQELEDELCMYDPETSKSPNRMDALVWALTELSGCSAGEPHTANIGRYGL